ncbi:hypothetical protein PRZ48_000810 [Zasmidium cellare]|uniref:HpcH/HpaI aldolase/citrate lyase domain-containing protein n=1 Tax=Zasmidium cellare TaxID=395010 RepID=A0ABR0EZJ2_ZASCE|nr:hypothetical protein PRZ48_000810 [Zasmidium cellare]
MAQVEQGSAEVDVLIGALDSGAHGIMVPLLKTVAEAEAVVKAAKFPSLGQRGWGSPFPVYGFPRSVNPLVYPSSAEYMQNANSSLVTAIQIETKEALDVVDELAVIPGIDVLFVGPFDLGSNLGFPSVGGEQHPRLRAALEKVVRAARSAGKVAGVFAVSVEEGRGYLKMGFQMVSVATDVSCLASGLSDALAKTIGTGDQHFNQASFGLLKGSPSRTLAMLILLGLGLLLVPALAAVNLTNPFPLLPCNGVEIKDISVHSLQEHFSSGRLTSFQLTQCYVDRIALTNPYLRHVIEINPDWQSIAKSLDDERAQGIVRGPLHGIPVLTKDNIATLDKQSTTDGNLALLGSQVPDDAFIIKRLRAAGVVLLGHANESEDADHRAVIDFAEGWSDRGGQCRNVWNGTQQTAGSSTGSAQAVAG